MSVTTNFNTVMPLKVYCTLDFNDGCIKENPVATKKNTNVLDHAYDNESSIIDGFD